MVQINIPECDECGTCIGVCSENALLLSDVLSVDQEKCSSCQSCVSICPFGALRISSPNNIEKQ